MTQEKNSRLQLVLLAAIALAVWGGMILKLTTDWSTNPQYEFGYFVPFFIVYLLVRRWPSRPEFPPSRPAALAATAGILLLLALLPIRVIQEANPDWRPFNWVHAAIVVTLSLVPIALTGGWKWVRHFGFPFVLIFLALPWPLAIEQGVLQALTKAVTAVTVELLNFMNIPALQRGNVIDLAGGSVGVADACSGIRSLAGTLMASVFFGEFYLLNAARRILLVLCGTVLAFVLNLVRTFFLSWKAASEGVGSIEKWHDPAGFTIFLVSFAGLWLLATALNKRQTFPESSPPPAALPFHLHPALLTCILVWVLASSVASEMWYRFREGTRPSSVAWEMQWPEESHAFRVTDIPEETRSILRYTVGKSATFDWSDGSIWQVFFFRWAPGRSSVQLATMHRPEICLPAVGYKFISEVEPATVAVAKLTLPFTGSVFDSTAGRVYVFRCLWEDYPLAEAVRNRNFDMSIFGRLRSSWYGRRNLGQRLLQIAIAGAQSEQEAREQMQRRLSELIVSNG